MALAGLCEVLFHIDQGNQVDAVFPPGAFSEEELSDIAFCAFPVRPPAALLLLLLLGQALGAGRKWQRPLPLHPTLLPSRTV